MSKVSKQGHTNLDKYGVKTFITKIILFQEEDIHTLDQSTLTTVVNENIFKEKVNPTNQTPTKIRKGENIANVETVKVIELEDITLLSQRDASSDDEVNASISYSEIFQQKQNCNICFNMAFPNTSNTIIFEEVTLMTDSKTNFEEINVLDTDEHDLSNKIDLTYHPNTVYYRQTKHDNFDEEMSAKVIPKSEGTQPANREHNNKGSIKAVVKENEDIRFVVQNQENETFIKIVDSLADRGASISKSNIFR